MLKVDGYNNLNIFDNAISDKETKIFLMRSDCPGLNNFGR